MTTRSPVVVGVDGSQSGLAAARYGAEMAQRRAAPLHLINAYIPPFYGRGPTGRFDPYVVLDTQPESDPDQELQQLTELIHKEFPDLAELQAWQEHGPPARTLIDRSANAAVTVVGSRGVGGFTELLLGSVASQVAAHGHGTIIVVRPPVPGRTVELGPEQKAAPPAHLGPVLVGIDGSAQANAALEFAAAEAALRQVPLIITTVYWFDDPWTIPQANGLDPAAQAEQTAQRLVAAASQEVAAAHPLLRVENKIIHNVNTGFSLVEASRDAALIVTGSRGRGGFTGVLLGSVSRSLVHHAHCPVAVTHGSSTLQGLSADG